MATPPGKGGVAGTVCDQLGDRKYSTPAPAGTQASVATSAIEAFDFKPINKGSIKASLSVRIGGITVNGCTIIQQDGQRAWLSMPTREWTGKDGRRKWVRIVELSPALRERVEAVALAVWEGGR